MWGTNENNSLFPNFKFVRVCPLVGMYFYNVYIVKRLYCDFLKYQGQ